MLPDSSENKPPRNAISASCSTAHHRPNAASSKQQRCTRQSRTSPPGYASSAVRRLVKRARRKHCIPRVVHRAAIPLLRTAHGGAAPGSMLCTRSASTLTTTPASAQRRNHDAHNHVPHPSILDGPLPSVRQMSTHELTSSTAVASSAPRRHPCSRASSSPSKALSRPPAPARLLQLSLPHRLATSSPSSTQCRELPSPSSAPAPSPRTSPSRAATTSSTRSPSRKPAPSSSSTSTQEPSRTSASRSTTPSAITTSSASTRPAACRPGDPLYGKKMFCRPLRPHLLLLRPQARALHRARLRRHHRPTSTYEARVDEDQLSWLAADLAAQPAGTPIVVTTHIPLVTAVPLLRRATAPRLRRPTPFLNGPAAIKLFEGHNVLAVLQGHTHVNERVDLARHPIHHLRRRLRQLVARHPPGHPEGFTVVTIANGRLSTRYETTGFKSVAPENT